MITYDPNVADVLEHAEPTTVLNMLIDRGGDGFLADALQRIAHELTRRGDVGADADRPTLHKHATRVHDAATVLRASENTKVIREAGNYVCFSCRTPMRDAPSSTCTTPLDHVPSWRVDEFAEGYPVWKGAPQAAARGLAERLYGLPMVDGVRLDGGTIVVEVTGDYPLPPTYRGVPLRVEVVR